MKTPTTEAEVRALIDGGIEESLSLEYKAAAALSRKDRDKTAITKDLSAFANSAGGVVIYGIAEGTNPETQHAPMALSPVDRVAFPREWLDQVCALIQPKIEGPEIWAVQLASDERDSVYILSIPQSDTAH